MTWNIEEIISVEKEYGPLVYSVKPVVFIRGYGSILESADGTQYLDFIAGHGSANIGHGHPYFIENMQKAFNRFMVLHAAFPNEERAKLYKKLAELTPSSLKHTFLSNSGTEAVEAAIKIAIVGRRDIKKPHIIAMKRAFHGRTLGSLALTFGQPYRRAFESWLSPEVTFVSYGNFEDLKSAIKENTVAIIMEVIQGEGGVYPAPKEFPKQVREICNEKNISLIFDEIQTGIGRTGEMFAFEHYNVIPDIVCLAKSLAGGVPIGATIATDALFESFKKGEIASTFGGNPISCTAANITLDIIEKNNLLQRAKDLSQIIDKRFEEWKEDSIISQKIRDFRGIGLMRGLQVKGKAGPYLKAAFESKLLALTAGMTVIRFLPPLVTTNEQMNKGLDVIEEVLRT